MLSEELYFALRDVAAQARREKAPGPFAKTLLDVAHTILNLCQRDERVAMRFARQVLQGPTSLRATTGQLPEDTAEACWRLIGLFEYLAGLDENQAC